MRSHRILALALVGTLLMMLAVPVMAVEDAEETPTEEEAPTGDQVPAAEIANPDYTPAVVVADVPAEEVEQPWTTRYLVPTGIVIAILAIFGTAVQYFVQVVRTRYRPVE